MSTLIETPVPLTQYVECFDTHNRLDARSEAERALRDRIDLMLRTGSAAHDVFETIRLEQPGIDASKLYDVVREAHEEVAMEEPERWDGMN